MPDQNKIRVIKIKGNRIFKLHDVTSVGTTIFSAQIKDISSVDRTEIQRKRTAFRNISNFPRIQNFNLNIEA